MREREIFNLLVFSSLGINGQDGFRLESGTQHSHWVSCMGCGVLSTQTIFHRLSRHISRELAKKESRWTCTSTQVWIACMASVDFSPGVRTLPLTLTFSTGTMSNNHKLFIFNLENTLLHLDTLAYCFLLRSDSVLLVLSRSSQMNAIRHHQVCGDQ